MSQSPGPGLAREARPAPQLDAGVEARVRQLLEVPVAQGDHQAAAARKRQLVAYFRGLDGEPREALLARLENRADPLGGTFHYRLATATRNQLLALLRSPGATVETEERTETTTAVDRSAVADKTTASEDTWNSLIGEKSTPVDKFARVRVPKGLRLRTEPHNGAATTVIMPLDTFVKVERKTAHGWAYVIALGNDSGGANVSGAGFCEYDFLQVDPPEPGAHLHYVQGELPKDIAAKYYKGGGFDWGADARLFVEAMLFANQGRTEGVYRNPVSLSRTETLIRTEAQEENLRIWRGIGVKDNHAIWMPSREFVMQLKASGAISSGSISNNAWEFAKEVVEHAIDWAKYKAGYVVGLLEGAFGAIRDLVMGVVDLGTMLYDIGKAIINEGFIGAAQSFGKKIVDFFENAPETLKKLGQWFADKWNADDAWDRGLFQGEVIGYVAMTIIIIFLTAGAGTALQASGKFAQVIRVVRTLDAAGDIMTYAGKLRRVVKVPDEVSDAIKRADGGADGPGGGRAGGGTRRDELDGTSDTRGTDVDRAAGRVPVAELEAALPPELRGRVPVRYSDAVDGAGVRIHYADGQLRIEVGRNVEPRHVGYHANAARRLLRYQGPLGHIRRLLDAIGTKLRLSPGHGTRGFEAREEVKKLREIERELLALRGRIDRRLTDVGDADLATLDTRALDTELAEIQDQIELHQADIDSYEPGRGFVAAEGLGVRPELPVRAADLVETMVEKSNFWELHMKAKMPDGSETLWGTAYVPLDDAGLPMGGPEFFLDNQIQYQGKGYRLKFYDEISESDDPLAALGRKGSGEVTSATGHALDRTLELYRRRFGHLPDELPGSLVDKNKKNFQVAWLEYKKKGLSDEDAAQAAIREISYGKHRMARGYDEFEVRLGEPVYIDLGSGIGVEKVPPTVSVTAKRTRDALAPSE